MSVTNSPNMNLPIPSVGTQPGPDYATNVNTALTLIDSHDHTPGNGIQIPTAGLNINTDLSFNDNAATTLRAAVFSTQPSIADLQAIYVLGTDLYYRDGDNNEVRITESGSVVGTPGSITGLPSGTAGVNFSGGVFTFSASTNTPANIQIGSVLLGNNTVLSNYLTLAPPNSMASNYQITLPALPGSTQILQMSSSGIITAALAVDNSTLQNSGTVLSVRNSGITATQIANATITGGKIAATTITGGSSGNIAHQTITQINMGAVGQQVSSSSGSFTTAAHNAGNTTLVTNLTATITTTGRPVMLRLQDDGSGSPGVIKTLQTTSGASTTISTAVFFLRGGSTISKQSQVGTGGPSQTVGSASSAFTYFDAVAAGTYTYTVAVTAEDSSGSTPTTSVLNTKLLAYEL